jgi:hypothetical protein
MTSSSFFIKIIVVLLLFNTNLFAQTQTVMKGEAFNDKNQLVYVETHIFKKLPTGEITELKTEYHNPAGKLIAEITSSFAKDPFVPDSVFTDYRFNEKQELVLVKESNEIIMTITDLKTKKFKTNKIKRTDNMVSGQGFHNYILKHFDDNRADIKFIVLPKLDYFSFYFQKVDAKKAGVRRFSLKISNFILRALVKEINVEYKEEDRSLLLFDGLTNIDSDDRKSQILKIKMSYVGAK